MASPEDKEMKKQWITVDGRQTPIILPQIWDHDKEEWIVTGTNNPLPTQVTGSYVEYKRSDVTNKNELKQGGYEKIDTLAKSGEIAEIVHYGIRARPPADYGATKGTHRIIISFFNDGSWNRLLDIQVAYSSTIEIIRGMCLNDEAIPKEKSIQIALSMGLIIDENTPFRVMYMNNTDATVPAKHVEGNVFLLKEGSE